jgi:ribonuclease J
VYESLEKIHVSGHACQEEHKILHSLLRPKFFIPVHGEYRHLKRHVDLAVSMGIPERNTIIPELGNCVELTDRELTLGENIPAGARLIDGEGIEEYGASEVMKDRVRMSNEGLFTVALAVSGSYVINDPVIQSLGFVAGENKCTLPELTAVVQRAVENYDYDHGNKDELSLCVKKALRNYLYKKTKQSPLIVVTVLEL